MAAYLCIARNGIPPIVSKRIQVSVDCKSLKTFLSLLQEKGAKKCPLAKGGQIIYLSQFINLSIPPPNQHLGRGGNKGGWKINTSLYPLGPQLTVRQNSVPDFNNKDGLHPLKVSVFIPGQSTQESPSQPPPPMYFCHTLYTLFLHSRTLSPFLLLFCYC